MGASWRIGVVEQKRTTLVTGGPFAHVRNPIFTAVMVFAVGMLLAVPNVVSLVGFATVVAGIQLQVRLVEEPYLLRAHGAAYREYAARVGRFVPAVGRLRLR
jgi:protein-S-isoprenylcysteine O-methyltransferase Ste14